MDKLIPQTHIYWVEYKCLCCSKLPPDFYLDIRTKEIGFLYQMLFSCFEQIRQEYGKPIIISRGYSCTKHHLYIYLEKLRPKYGLLSKQNIIEIIKNPGLTPYSVHIFGLALDLIPPQEDIPQIVEIAKTVKPKLRIGVKAYERNIRPHIHIDLGYKISPRFNTHLHDRAEW